MKYLFLISCFFFNYFISYSQELDLNKTNINLVEKTQDIIERTSVKINYSYLSGLDFFYLRNNGSKSGIISLSFHYRVNKWNYGIGMNYSNYIAYDNNYNLTSKSNTIILTPLVTFERYVYKKLYLGVHLGCNIIRDYFLDKSQYVFYGENDAFYEYVANIYYNRYIKFCAGYQFKLSNRLNFNLELGVGGSMTNTGFAYLFR